MTIDKKALLRDYDRAMIKSMVMSLFWAVIADRKKRHKYTLQTVADAMGRDKSQVSRWFSSPPNWRLETVADMAAALDLELEFRAVDRQTGIVFTPSGPVGPVVGAETPATTTPAPETPISRDEGRTFRGERQMLASVG